MTSQILLLISLVLFNGTHSASAASQSTIPVIVIPECRSIPIDCSLDTYQSAISDAEKQIKIDIQSLEPTSNSSLVNEWTGANASILTTTAQIMAAALSIAAGALAAFVSLLISARAAAELKLMEIGSEIRSKFNTYDHLWWMSWPDMSLTILEKYRYSFPYESRGKLLWRIFFDIAKRSCDSENIDLQEAVKLNSISRYGAMMCHIAELSIDSLDPNSADRRYDVVNFNSEYLATRVYRSVIFPNGVSQFSGWFDRFVAFERMTSMLMHRYAEIIPDILSIRTDWTPERVEARLNDMITLAKAVSPLAYQAEAINKDITRVSSAIHLAKRPSLLGALLISTVVGVFLPVALLAIKPGDFQVALVYLILICSVVCIAWPGIGLVKVLRATFPVSNERFAVISELREYFKGLGVLERDLIPAVNIPLSHKELIKLGFVKLAEALEKYESAASLTIPSGEFIKNELFEKFNESKISEDFPSAADQGAFLLNLDDLIKDRAAQIFANRDNWNVEVWIRCYSRLNLVPAKFRVPSSADARVDLLTRLSRISEYLNSLPELVDWKRSIISFETCRDQLLEELRKAE